MKAWRISRNGRNDMLELQKLNAPALRAQTGHHSPCKRSFFLTYLFENEGRVWLETFEHTKADCEDRLLREIFWRRSEEQGMR